MMKITDDRILDGLDYLCCQKEICIGAYDLINRQKAKIEQLNIELKAMRGACESYKMHYDNAQAEVERLNAVSEICGDCHKKYAEKIERTKSEAIREFADEFIKVLKDALYGLDIKQKTISREEMRKRFESLMHKDIPEVIEYVKNKMVGDGNGNNTTI